MKKILLTLIAITLLFSCSKDDSVQPKEKLSTYVTIQNNTSNIVLSSVILTMYDNDVSIGVKSVGTIQISGNNKVQVSDNCTKVIVSFVVNNGTVSAKLKLKSYQYLNAESNNYIYITNNSQIEEL